jgi:hypothetical protein
VTCVQRGNGVSYRSTQPGISGLECIKETQMAEDSQAAVDGVDADKADAAKLTKKLLIEAVTARTAQRKTAVKDIVDAVLGEIGQALTRGEMLVLPPLGRVTLARKKTAERGEVLVLKLRRTPPSAAAGTPQDADED